VKNKAEGNSKYEGCKAQKQRDRLHKQKSEQVERLTSKYLGARGINQTKQNAIHKRFR
jgi:hypothetical protein